ncbi:MAG: hypothetical protein QM777_04815 [Pseudorhodoferax sp.]
MEKTNKIEVQKGILAGLNAQLETLKHNMSDYKKIYYHFLKDLQELSEEFSVVESDEQGVMQIIYRYETLETKRAELVQEHRRDRQPQGPETEGDPTVEVRERGQTPQLQLKDQSAEGED